jgi:GT2 family glycosyltransferase
MPDVSIIILSYHHPEIIDVCLRQLEKHTYNVTYEVVVVDNGSGADTIAALQQHKAEGRIDTLVLNGFNGFFSQGNNIGVAHTDLSSKYLLFMNSDVAPINDWWLVRMLEWIEGEAQHWPTVWGLKPQVPADQPLDILSYGWRHDANIQPGRACPEGFCMLWRRETWRPFDENFPFHHGWEHTASECIRDGARCGVLFNYAPYIVHREQGSGQPIEELVNTGVPDHNVWLSGLPIQTLDFYLGPDEHSSYLSW